MFKETQHIEFKPNFNEDVIETLVAMYKKEMLGKMNLSDRKYFRLSYLQPSIELGLIEMTIPDKPNSHLQKYRLTTKGIEMKNKLKN